MPGHIRSIGTTNIPVNTFNKVWIVPDKARYMKGNTVYVLKAHLKVMLEEDYLSLKKHDRPPNVNDPMRLTPSAPKSSVKSSFPKWKKKSMKARILPISARYILMILAAWYKRT